MQRPKFQRLSRLIRLVVFCLLSVCSWAQTTSLPLPERITDQQGLPQSFVPGLVQDHQGFIWIATRDGLCRYDGYHFKIFRPNPDTSSSPSFSNIKELRLDHQGRIWILSEQADIDLFDPRIETFTNFSRQIFFGQPFDQTLHPHCYPDRQNRLWLALNGQGLISFDMATRRFRKFRHQTNQPSSLASDHVRSILQDNQGIIWVATDAGLDQYQPRTGQFRHYNPQSSTPLALPENDLYTLFQQPSGEILIGSANYVTCFNPKTYQVRPYPLPAPGEPRWGMHFATDSKGVVYFDQLDRLFRFTNEEGIQLLTRLTKQTGHTASLFIDRFDVLWLGTNGSGIRKYDLRSDGFKTARYQVNFQTDLLTHWLGVPSQLVMPFLSQTDPYHFRYTLDRRGGLWINSGNSTFYRVTLATHQAEKIDFPVAFKETICPLSTDQSGRIWVLYTNQFWWYEPELRRWQSAPYRFDRKQTGDILQLVADEEAFWLATAARGLFRFDRRSGQLRQYVYQTNQPTSLNNNALFCLSADPQDANQLWVGTFGSGLCVFDKRSGRCRRISERDGLPNNVVYSALPDGGDYVWIGTNKGLCRMNRRTLRMRTYTIEDGLLANEFNRFHYIQLPTNEIVMGGVDGFTSFQPALLRDDRFEPKVELTELQVNNLSVKPAVDSPLQAPIQVTNQLLLPYNQNFIMVGFAALQYNRPGANRYRYQLLGIDPNWVESSQPQANYTALSPGTYTLLVNASNTSGQWSRYVRKLTLTIHSPWWATVWAYCLYGLAIAMGIGLGLRLHLNRLRLQQTIALRQQEAHQLRELDAMKSRFFSNVTHDFRTPLTLILSPMDEILKDLEGTKSGKRLESVHRNAKQLLGLINQLLDFSKLDAKSLSVHEVRGDLSVFTAQTIQLFAGEAANKAISLTYQLNVEDDYWFDADKLERILTNLLSNALKFTPAGGQINVRLTENQGILLRVSDTGVGIASNMLPFIFDRFFQIEKTNELVNGQRLHQVGTGIGLALVKELVELQGGRIEVESQVGVGTTFRVSLPYRCAGEEVHPPELVVELPALIEPVLPRESEGEHPLGEQPHLLLVEDNHELAEFVTESLPAHYRISRSANGAEGLELALMDLPDLVISDVMMPVMDGYTFCQKLKEDERTNHIPVILLTAKVTLDNRLEGLGRGADDYLTKPFHVPELNLRIYNLLERQRRSQERIRQELAMPNWSQSGPELPSPATLNPFLEKFYSIVEAKLDDTSFSIEDLAEQLNLSRSFLHRKVKALTGLAASDLMRTYRLKRATEFLRQGFNSSETAYRVGFESPQYFSKCFREQYQMTPLKFAKKK